jgi:DNA (cytosine-5)-methyltransferase 1
MSLIVILVLSLLPSIHFGRIRMFLDASTKFIDLFAGIGGFHQALVQVGGCQCVYASDIDRYARQTYEANYGILPDGDITKVDAADIPAHDVLCGGFPCQAFSISGNQLGFEDARGTLFAEIVRIAKHHQPKMLFLENVWNLKNHDHGNTFKVICSALDEAGYVVYSKVLNASEYGVPQPRKRIYMICLRKDLNLAPFRFPEPTNEDVALEDILIRDGSADAYAIPTDKVTLVPQDEIDSLHRMNKPQRIGSYGKGGQGERIYSPKGHAITLSAYGGGIGGKTGLYLVDGKVRKLSPRECLRLMGYPDSFVMPVSDAQAWKQTGNSVCVKVLVKILEAVNEQYS